MQEDFKGLVYYLKSVKRFLIVDYDGEPAHGDRVAVERLDRDRIAIERFNGQKYFGVVRILNFYALKHSEQYAPKKQKKPRDIFPRELAC